MEIIKFKYKSNLFRLKCTQEEIQAISTYANLIGKEFIVVNSLVQQAYLIDSEELVIIKEFISIYGKIDEIETN